MLGDYFTHTATVRTVNNDSKQHMQRIILSAMETSFLKFIEVPCKE